MIADRRTGGWPLAAMFLAGSLFGGLAAVEIVPAGQAQLVAAPGSSSAAAPDPLGSEGRPATTPDVPGDSPTAATTTPGAAGPAAPPDSADPGAPATGPAAAGGPASAELACSAGRNGGATDRGVTADEIQLATTVVESGIGSAFLGEVRYAMDAVVNRVNREGGICGRLLQITYRDDGWSADRGAQFLRNFIEQGVFAIPVGPSSEGLNAVIESGDFDRAGLPVVGTDGLIVKQYQRQDGSAQPWVWPVAVATVSSARIMARDAYERGARNFSIVFDSNYRFGVEGAEAFNAEVRRLTGADVSGYQTGATSCNKSFCGVSAGQSSYSAQVQAFTEGDYVALFLEPDTALKWMNDANAPHASSPSVPYGFGAAQPLFTRSFAENCKTKCDGMAIWTGFKPFQERYRSDPDVQRFVNDLRATNPNADVDNQFSMGAYVGMELLVEGLRAVGPNLTREGLRTALDRIQFSSGLTLQDPLDYGIAHRYVARTMQAWVVQYKGTFAGWKAAQVAVDPMSGA